jgi:hypothetical protein
MAPTRTSSRRLPILVASLVFALVCGYALTANLSDAGAARAKILGNSGQNAKPSCPAPNVRIVPQNKQCQVQARVTGFQKSIDGRNGAFKVKSAGHIVAWKVDLSRPDADERKFFERNLDSADFGSRSTARISVLRKSDRMKYKLTKQSPVVEVNQYFNEAPTFTLTEPLRVKAGDIVALTTPTWLPNFAHARLGRDTAWVASRGSKKCEGEENLLEKSKPHQKVDSVRKYGCVYRGARLLYWAFFVPGR